MVELHIGNSAEEQEAVVSSWTVLLESVQKTACFRRKFRRAREDLALSHSQNDVVCLKRGAMTADRLAQHSLHLVSVDSPPNVPGADDVSDATRFAGRMPHQ